MRCTRWKLARYTARLLVRAAVMRYYPLGRGPRDTRPVAEPRAAALPAWARPAARRPTAGRATAWHSFTRHSVGSRHGAAPWVVTERTVHSTGDMMRSSPFNVWYDALFAIERMMWSAVRVSTGGGLFAASILSRSRQLYSFDG